MVVEKAGLQAKAKRKDISVIEVPAIEMAISLSGTSQGANLILLGAFVRATQIISPQVIKRQLKETFAHNEETLKANLKAFDQGLNLIKEL
jgi:Pyruvate/2-oxoacid:ferredoxin oxidoreductase gamma subunit